MMIPYDLKLVTVWGAVGTELSAVWGAGIVLVSSVISCVCVATVAMPSTWARSAAGGAASVSWPTNGLQVSKDTGRAFTSIDELEHGLEMLPEAATFETGGRSVEVGIQMLVDRMRSARFKVFANAEPFCKEYWLYHCDPLGKIKKSNDHVLDSCHYAVMILRHAETDDEQRGQLKALPHQTNQQLGIV